MISLSQLRAIALALPEVTEGPPVPAARRIASFKVRGKSFLGLEKEGRTMTASLAEKEAKKLAVAHPEAYEEIWRNQKTFMGLRADLSKVPISHVRKLIEVSWRHTAPEVIVTAYDNQK